MRVLVCGHIGHSDQIDGQSIKTRVLIDGLRAIVGSDCVATADTASVFRHPVRFFREVRRKFVQSSHVIMLPGSRALKLLLPLFVFWRLTAAVDVRYVVIGGWLPDLLTRMTWLRRCCRRLDGIYVETMAMAGSLRDMGLTNVHVLPNFRLFDRARRYVSRKSGLPLKLVYCARIVKEKGIEDAVEAIRLLNGDLGPPLAFLDIYGPIAAPYQARFEHLLAPLPHVTYKGVLAAADVPDALREYDLLIFPTYYDGEGFPGTILDAYIAGVPVLASSWRYNDELVEPGVTGSFVPVHAPEVIAETLRGYAANPEILATMRPNCMRRADDYHVDIVLGQLLQDMRQGFSPVAGDHPSASRSAEGRTESDC